MIEKFRNKWGIPLVAFLLVAVFALIDVLSDLQEGAGALHVTLELMIVIISGGSAIYILNRILTTAKLRYQRSESELHSLQQQAELWRREAQSFLQGLASHIDSQLEKWQFTRSEKEIALLIIKGFSLQEISGIRQVKEKTVRQQCTAIYRKAGVSGRAELAAFFLEDLLLPVQA